MRILHVVHQYPPDHVGGTEIYTQSLARHQKSDGHQVAVFAPTSISATEYTKTDVIDYRPFVGERSAAAIFRSTLSNQALKKAFIGTLQDFQPELIHLQHLRGLPASILKKISEFNLPFVVSLHDYWYICANAQLLTNYDQTICSGPDRYLNCAKCALVRSGLPSNQIMSPILAPLMAWRSRSVRPALELAKRLIAPTQFVKSVYESFQIQGGGIDVIPHGIDVPENLAEVPMKRSADFVISYIGGLAWQKGVHILINAVNEMPDKGVRLKIFGDTKAFPDYTADLQRQAKHPGISLEGPLNRSQVWSAIRSSDIIAIPSLWYETASLIVQEAFAAGVPVMASRIGALEERVADGKNGVLVEPGDTNAIYNELMNLFKNPRLLEELRNGIEPVRTVAEHAAELEQLYKEFVQS